MTRSHDVPVYGFERIVDPPPLDVNVARLLEEFAKGRHHRRRPWEAALHATPTSRSSSELSQRGRARASTQATRADTPTAVDDAGFNFPDEPWARVVYDFAVAASGDAPCRSTSSWRR